MAKIPEPTQITIAVPKTAIAVAGVIKIIKNSPGVWKRARL
jgi:hypothetical protein